jgi:hypothetical protein
MSSSSVYASNLHISINMGRQYISCCCALCILGITYIMKRICSTVNTFRYQAVHTKTERSFMVIRKLCTFQDEIYYNGTNCSFEEIL